VALVFCGALWRQFAKRQQESAIGNKMTGGKNDRL
jgi:hypothetical protein